MQDVNQYHVQFFNKVMNQIYNKNPDLLITKVSQISNEQVDETGTSKIATRVIERIEGEYNTNGILRDDKELNDQIAAILILQKYCDYFNGI